MVNQLPCAPGDSVYAGREHWGGTGQPLRVTTRRCWAAFESCLSPSSTASGTLRWSQGMLKPMQGGIEEAGPTGQEDPVPTQLIPHHTRIQ